MAINQFSFDPENGFLDNTYYEDTPANSREILQRQHNQTKDYINSLVNTLNSQTLGSSGSESIKSPAIEGITGNNVYEQIKDVKTQINQVVIDSVPDASITNLKLANQSVTSEKIANLAISNEHFHPEAICPFAKEPVLINGVKKSDYEPIQNISNLSLFKHRVTDTALTSVYGKNLSDSRYLFYQKKIYKLNLSTGEFTLYADSSHLNSDILKFAFDSNGTLYYAYYYVNTTENSMYIDFYRYEFGTYEKVTSIRLFTKTGYSCPLIDIDIWENKVYFSFNYVLSSNTYLYGYSVDLSALSTTTYLSPFFSKVIDSSCDAMFVHDGDLYVGPYVIRDFNSQTIEKISGVFVCANDEGALLVYHPYYVILEKENLRPKFCTIGSLPSYVKKSFLKGNDLYTLIDQYLFKTRIL